MKLIIGLGNPGEKYKNTRHNVTSQIRNSKSEILNKRMHHSVGKIQIFKSKNFMNDSGVFVAELTKRYSLNPNHLYVVHDDLDIPLGTFKIQFGRGPKDHNGIKSVDSELGTNEYYRVRVGIENRDPENKISGEKYTLEDFTEEERKLLNLTIKKLLIDLIALISK